MPSSQLVLPSFALVITGSITFRDVQSTQNPEGQNPIQAPSSNEDLTVQRAHGILFAATSATYVPWSCPQRTAEDPDATSSSGDANEEETVSNGLLWRQLKKTLLKVKGFRCKLFTF